MTSGPADTEIVADEAAIDEEMPRLRITRRTLIIGGLFIVSALAFLYWGMPRITGLEDTWHRIEEGNPWWLALAFAFTVASFAGYVVLFQFVYVRAGSRIDLKASYQITMAGLAATRIFAAGGAGGIALTAWALRRSGMGRRRSPTRPSRSSSSPTSSTCLAMIVCGLLLRLGVLNGPNPFAMTVVPAIFAGVITACVLALALVPTDIERRLSRWAEQHHHERLAKVGRRLATVPASVSVGVREAISHIRSGDPALLGSLAFWGFNIAVLWACFHAFGDPPPWGIIVMAYFVGMLGNLLPLPGGVGGVDGGMIGVFAAFASTSVSPRRRADVPWLRLRLPTIPGAIAYFQLRHTVAKWRREREREQEDRVAVPA